MVSARSQLQLHLEPKDPIEVYELTAALSSLARQYNLFVDKQKFFRKAGDGRLLVSSVSPGSIDIGFVPDLTNAIAVAAPFISDVRVVSEFADHIKGLLEKFLPSKDDGDEKEKGDGEISVKDCDDAVNIVRPTAEHGGSQTFNIYNGTVIQPVVTINVPQSRAITEQASRTKTKLLYPQAERRQRVSMVWNRLDRGVAKTEGSSPDKGIIQEIDPKAKTILFTDELSYLKREMVSNEDNPMQKAYFVDVEVSRVGERVSAYRIVGFHGTDDLDPTPSLEDLL